MMRILDNNTNLSRKNYFLFCYVKVILHRNHYWKVEVDDDVAPDLASQGGGGREPRCGQTPMGVVSIFG